MFSSLNRHFIRLFFSDRGSTFQLPLLNRTETFAIFLLIPLCFYVEYVHYLFHIDSYLPFLPLLLTSIYCSIWIIYSWIRLHFIQTYHDSQWLLILDWQEMTTNVTAHLLNQQWIHSGEANEYLKAIKERNEDQLRDFCKKKR